MYMYLYRLRHGRSLEMWVCQSDPGGTRCYKEGREKYARDRYVRVWRFGALFVVYLCVRQVHHSIGEL